MNGFKRHLDATLRLAYECGYPDAVGIGSDGMWMPWDMPGARTNYDQMQAMLGGRTGGHPTFFPHYPRQLISPDPNLFAKVEKHLRSFGGLAEELLPRVLGGNFVDFLIRSLPD